MSLFHLKWLVAPSLFLAHCFIFLRHRQQSSDHLKKNHQSRLKNKYLGAFYSFGRHLEFQRHLEFFENPTVKLFFRRSLSIIFCNKIVFHTQVERHTQHILFQFFWYQAMTMNSCRKSSSSRNADWQMDNLYIGR